MKKILLIVLAVLAVGGIGVGIFALAGGFGIGDSESSTPSGGGLVYQDGDFGDAAVYTKVDKITIFIADSDAREHAEELRETLSEWTGQKVAWGSELTASTDCDIVVGYMESRQVSVNAYKLLDRLVPKESYFEGRYLIYVEDGQMAIAYDKNEASSLSALDYACRYLKENYIDGELYMAFGEGVVYYNTIDLIKEQENIDVGIVNEAWAKLEALKGREFTEALKQYYTLYLDSMVDWLANLYAPGLMDVEGGLWAGGFYGAPSGRDTAGFGPDITGTKQVLNLMANSGALNNLGGSWAENIPESMRQEIIYMIKSLQDPTDGRFYHPQYDKETMEALGDTQRSGRDLSAAIDMLNELGVRPTYDIPSRGVKGDGILPDGTPVESLTSHVGADASEQVARMMLASKVVAVSTVDEMLSSHNSFGEYLNGLDINNKSYSVGNNLNAISSDIKSASNKLGPCTVASSPYYGKTLLDMLFDFLDSHIVESTGMWEDNTKFSATNGFYKCISLYQHHGRPFAKPGLAAVGLIDALLGDQKSTGNICDVYNIWIGLSDLRSNVKIYSTLPADERQAVLDYIDEQLDKYGADAIINSYNKYLPYRYDDGSFSDNVGSAATHHNGLPVSLGLPEGDTNATAIAMGVVGHILSSFGIPSSYKVPVYTESDWMRFIGIIMELQTVEKYSYLSDDISQDFESYDAGEFVGDGSLLFSSGGVSKAYIIEEGGNSYAKFVKNGTNASGSITVKGTQSVNKSTILTAEFRMNVVEANSGRISVNLKHTNGTPLTTIYFNGEGKNVRYDSILGWHDTGIAKGEWFTVKIEYFVGDGATPRMLKVYLNGTLMDIRNTVTNNIDPKFIGSFTFIPLYAFEGTVLLDDVKISKENRAPDTTEQPLIYIPEYDYATDGGKHTFEAQTPGLVPSGAKEDYMTWSDGGVSSAVIVDDGKNKYLEMDKTAKEASGTLNLKFDASEDGANVLTLTMRMSIEAKNSGRVSILLKNSGGDTIKKFYFSLSGSVIRFESIGGWIYAGAKNGEWFDLKIVYYEGADADHVYIGTYVNDVLVDVDTTADKAIEAEKIVGLSLTPLFDYLGKVSIDDVSIKVENKAYDISKLPTATPPTLPGEEGGSGSGGSGSGNEGGGTVTPPTEEKENIFKNDGKQTFESIPEGAIADQYADDYFKYSAGNVSTAQIVVDGENKYFRLDKTAKAANGVATFIFDKSEWESSILYLEFDMRISGANSQRANVELRSSSGKALKKSYFKADGSSIAFEGAGGWTKTDAKVGEWFSVKIVYYEGADKDNVYVGTYVNDKLVDVSSKVLENLSTESVNTVVLQLLNDFTGKVDIDNLEIYKTDDSYDIDQLPTVPEEGGDEPETPTEPDTPPTPEVDKHGGIKNPEGVFDFEGAEVGEITGNNAAGSLKFTVNENTSAAIVDAGGNKVLQYTKINSVAGKTLYITGTNGQAGVDTVTVTLKMRFISGSNRVRLMLSSTSNDTAMIANAFDFKKDGNKILVDAGGTKTVETDENGWFDVKFVYYEGDENDGTAFTNRTLKVYVNGTLIYEYTSFQRDYTAESVARLNISTVAATNAVVQLDDISFVHSVGPLPEDIPGGDEPTTPPTEPDEGENEGGSGGEGGDEPETPTEPETPPVPEESYKSAEGAFDFEGVPESSIAVGTNKGDLTFSQGSAVVSIVTDSESKVLKLVEGSNSSQTVLKLAFEGATDANTTKISFRMKLISSGNDRLYVHVNNESGNRITRIPFGASGSNLTIGKEGTAMEAVEGETLGEWMTVEIVYYEGEGASNEGRKLEVLIDGVLCATRTEFERDASAEKVTSISFVTATKWTGSVMIDDVSLVHSLAEK